MIKGVIEFVDQFELHGWAFDTDRPDQHLTIDIVLGGRQLGTAAAGAFRQDLMRAGMGKGDHAFAFKFTPSLEAAMVPQIRAEAHARDGATTALPRWQPPPPEAPPRFSGLTSDPSQFPVFVLGSVRSGTSVMVEGLLGIERYRGYNEGHILDLLRYLSQQAEAFYNLKHLDAQPDRNTMIRRVPIAFLQDGFDHIFIDLARQLFGQGHWVEKTPNVAAILLSQRFRRLWPNARFIFMRRRALENLASRGRKFPHYDFTRNCDEWRDAMQAWLSVRDHLHGAAIEVDQFFLARHPARTAAAIAGFLNLDATATGSLEQIFTLGRPQQTAALQDQALSLDAMNWSTSSVADFNRICRPVMEQFGYTTEPSYHRDGDAAGLVLL